MREKKRYLFLFLLVVLFVTQPVSAYLDPGTGSFIWQMMIGFVLGSIFMLKIYWQKIKSFYKDLVHHESK